MQEQGMVIPRSVKIKPRHAMYRKKKGCSLNNSQKKTHTHKHTHSAFREDDSEEQAQERDSTKTRRFPGVKSHPARGLEIAIHARARPPLYTTFPHADIITDDIVRVRSQRDATSSIQEIL